MPPGVPSRTAFTFACTVAAIALAWRLVGLTDWPATAYPTLQYESALAARALATDFFPSDRDPERLAWRDAVGAEYFVAPPILPAMVAAVYLATGEEAPWVSRVFTIGLWLLAGAVIHRTIARTTGSGWAAAAGFTWFVLCPFGMILSRSFQTESLLAFAFACGVLLLSKPLSLLSWRRTVFAGLACGAIAFVKPGILFAPLLGGFAAVVMPRSVPGRLRDKLLHMAAFGVLMILPGTVYALGLLKPHAGRILPELLGEAWFYQGLAFQIRGVLGPAAWLGLLGVAMAAHAHSYLAAGLLAGHLATQAVFTYHAATHDYYQAPLMVIAAVALGWPVAALERAYRRRERLHSRPVRIAILMSLAMGVAGCLVFTRDAEIGPFRWLPENRAAAARNVEERHQRARRAEVIRGIVGVRKRVVELTEQYGYPLRFHGWAQTVRWPTIEERDYMARVGATPPEFSAQDYLRQIIRDVACRYLVVTDMHEWDRQPDLRIALAAFGDPIIPCAGVMIFDLMPTVLADR